jgi:D-inositol-3-phosphate glycosyltransferase
MVEEGGRGGVGDYMAQLAPELARLGQPLELVTADDHLFAPAPGVKILPWFHYVRGTSAAARALRRVGLGRIVNGFRFLIAFARAALISRRTRLVHVHGGEWLPIEVVAMCMFRAAGRAIVYTPNNTFERYASSERALRMLEALSARTIVHTRADLANLARPERAVVIPHGEYGALARTGGTADREDARRELGLDPEVPVTLVFGQLRPDKWIRDVLLAARDTPDLHVLIAGEDIGGLATATDVLADPALSGRVMVREGFVEMSEAATMFAAADTVTLAYRQASQSGVLLLAYGFKRPVVVYPAGGLPEAVIDGETGWVCASPDPAALAAALRETVEAGPAECLRRGEAGARLADERYSWTEIARRTIEVYDAVESGTTRFGRERSQPAS